jgi:hypothetical protein
VQVSKKQLLQVQDVSRILALLCQNLVCVAALNCVQVSKKQLLQVQEAEVLDLSGILAKPEGYFGSRDKRMLTSMYYKQDK